VWLLLRDPRIISPAIRNKIRILGWDSCMGVSSYAPIVLAACVHFLTWKTTPRWEMVFLR